MLLPFSLFAIVGHTMEYVGNFGEHMLHRPDACSTQVRGSGIEDEADRVSLDGGVRDLAVVEALLASSAAGGGTVPVASIPCNSNRR